MKHIKTVLIVLLLASNAYFIGAYQKQKSQAHEARMIAEESREQALQATTMAEQAQAEALAQTQRAVLAHQESQERVEELKNKIADLERK